MAGNQFTRVIQRLRRTVSGPADGPGDPELLRRYADARDEQAFTALVERHGPMVRGVCRRVLAQDADADDAFQATFLVLARKAGAGFWQESVSGWLYQVAYRTASKARVETARRQRHEQAAGSRPGNDSGSPEMRELRQVLDEELSRLPEKFRLPVLLCCLQDQTTDEAARQLGWSFATVKGRLQRGREMLRKRLQKRDIALSAGVLGTLLTESSAGAAPVALVSSTVQAAVTGTISVPVAALVKGVSHAMFWAKMKIVAAVLVVGAVLGIGGGIGVSRLGSGGSVALAVPIPQEQPGKTKGNEEPMPSKPVLKDGLEVVVKPTRAVFGKGQRPSLEIRFTNRSTKMFQLESINFHAIPCLTCVDTKTGDRWVGNRGPYKGMPFLPLTATLEPGKSVVQTYKWVPYTFQLLNPNGVELRKESALPPGKYRVTCSITFQAENRLRNLKPFWTGEITTNPVEVVIADAKAADAGASKPVLKDGLEVVVKPTRASFPVGQEPTLEITFTNRGTKAFRLCGINHATDVDLSWLCVDGRGEFRSIPLSESTLKTGRDAWPAAGTIVLEPGKSFVQNVRVHGPFNCPQQKRPLAALLPGKYRVTTTFVFRGPGKDGPAGPIFWTGEITTNPVEVVIAEAKAEVKPGLSVKDAATGITVRVSDDRKSLHATDAAGKPIWTNKLIVDDNPAVIRDLSAVVDGKVHAVVTKNTDYTIDLRTGKTLASQTE